jgi:polysaccharide pyruvyl transferase WcaK-like protein
MTQKIEKKEVGLIYPHVGLFGAYATQNFGDDLMAIMFGLKLQSLGVPFTIFGLEAQYEKSYGFSIVSSVADLVKISDVILFGGGGLLLPHRGQSNYWERKLEALVRLCNERDIPILCLSIGGAGLSLEELRPPARRQLFEKSKYCTLRLRSEIPLLVQAGIEGRHHEDVVWMTSSFFPFVSGKTQVNRRPTIGINTYPINKLNRKLQSIFFHVLARVRSDYDFVFFESMYAVEGKNTNQVLLPYMGFKLSNCRFYKFVSVEDGIQFFSTLDFLVTSRLHVLIAALSYRIPCVSFLPRPKTVLCLKELGLDDLCWRGMRLWKVAYLFIPYLFKRLLGSFKEFDPITLQQSAALHFSDLERNLRDFLSASYKPEGKSSAINQFKERS